MGSSKKVTVGYRYYLGLHFGLCHGPVDEVLEVSVGERRAWSGRHNASGSVAIYAPGLFGGDKREGGVVGTLDVLMGESTQVENSYLQSKLGAAIPAFRGILSAVWRGGQVTANNPYLKPWAFRVSRINKGWSIGAPWYPEKSKIIGQCTIDVAAPLGLCFVIDASGSMAGGRIQAVKDALSSVLEKLKADYPASGITLDIAVATYSSEAYAFNGASIIRRGASAADIDAVKAFVNSITPDGGTEPKYGFAIANTFISGTSADLKKQVVHLTDGRPLCYGYADFTPEGMQCAVNATLALYSAVFSQAAVHTFNIDLDDTTYSIQLDNTPEDGLPVLSSATTGELEAAIANTVIYRLPDMNPAHMIYQCLTDSEWGMGYPTAAIDSASFKAAADALYVEGFGLSMLWNQQETIDQFIGIILDHIGGILYVRPDTSTFALRLVRADYDRGTLPLYGPETLISAEGYQRQGWGETINEITVVYTDCAGKDAPVTVQDPANILVQGGVVAQTRNYPGIRKASLAQRVALRDLQATSTPLASIKLTATRAAWQVFPGDVFRLNWPEYEIDDVVYRALNVNRGTLTDGQIIIDAVEDVFGLPDNTYLIEQPSEWEDPSNPPAEAPYRKLLEAPYWDLVQNLSAADLDYVDALSGYLETLAVRPSSDAIDYRIWAKIGAADYAEEGNGDFCASATIAETLTKTTTEITLENGIDLDIVVAGGYAVIEDECVLVSAIDAIAGTATISRGVLDTVPTAHSANARIFFADGYTGFSTTEFADGEVLDVKLLPITGRGELDIAVAPSDSITFDQRQYRPYPPANLLFDGVAWPASLTSGVDVVLTWAHRDRTLQTAYIVEQDEASIGPEASVTYSVEVADEALAVIHSETGITAATATIPASSLVDELLRFRVWSVRSGLASWQVHEHFAEWVPVDTRTTEAGDTRITESGDTRILE